MKLNSNHPTIKEWTQGSTVLHEHEDKDQTLRVFTKNGKQYELLRAWHGMDNETVYVSVDKRTTDLEEIVMALMDSIR